jgi:hypothetical protein
LPPGVLASSDMIYSSQGKCKFQELKTFLKTNSLALLSHFTFSLRTSIIKIWKVLLELSLNLIEGKTTLVVFKKYSTSQSNTGITSARDYKLGPSNLAMIK